VEVGVDVSCTGVGVVGAGPGISRQARSNKLIATSSALRIACLLSFIYAPPQ
jgi:hypothetical protein